MDTLLSCTVVRARSRSGMLAARLQRGAVGLLEFADTLSAAQWRAEVPGDGRPAGVIVHHVASVYPLEVRLAQMIARGAAIRGVTWTTIHEMNAAHAVENRGVTKGEALALLADNSAAAADVILSFTDEELDRAVTVSLYADAELTCQFFLEDHAVRHSYHHLQRLRSALRVQPRLCSGGEHVHAS